MLQIIPKEEERLINDILNFQDKLEYQAPEVLNSATVWIPLQQILNTIFQILTTNGKLTCAFYLITKKNKIVVYYIIPLDI